MKGLTCGPFGVCLFLRALASSEASPERRLWQGAEKLHLLRSLADRSAPFLSPVRRGETERGGPVVGFDSEGRNKAG